MRSSPWSLLHCAPLVSIRQHPKSWDAIEEVIHQQSLWWIWCSWRRGKIAPPDGRRVVGGWDRLQPFATPIQVCLGPLLKFFPCWGEKQCKVGKLGKALIQSSESYPVLILITHVANCFYIHLDLLRTATNKQHCNHEEGEPLPSIIYIYILIVISSSSTLISPLIIQVQTTVSLHMNPHNIACSVITDV